MSSATFCAWKARFGGLEGEADQAAFQWKDAPPNDAKKPKGLEDETARPKRLLADAMPDNAGLNDLLSRNW